MIRQQQMLSFATVPSKNLKCTYRKDSSRESIELAVRLKMSIKLLQDLSLCTLLYQQHSHHLEESADSSVRSVPVVHHYARDRESAAFSLEQVAGALRAHGGDLSLNSIRGEDILKCMEATEEMSFHYEADKENWSGIRLDAKKKQSNVRPVPTIITDSSSQGEDDSVQNTSLDTITGSSLDSYEWDL